MRWRGLVVLAVAIGFAGLRATERPPTLHDVGAILWAPALATAGIWLWVLLGASRRRAVDRRARRRAGRGRGAPKKRRRKPLRRRKSCCPRGLDAVPDLVAELAVRFDAMLERQQPQDDERLHRVETALARIEAALRDAKPREVIVREVSSAAPVSSGHFGDRCRGRSGA